MKAAELVILCNEAASGRNKTADNIVKLRTAGAHRNIRLELDEIGRHFSRDVPPQLVDLIEIATLVYVADQVRHRGAHDAESMGSSWRRRFRFEIPVRVPSLWRSAEVTEALVELLSFLSEDEYEFVFTRYQRPPSLDSYLTFGVDEVSEPPGSVILFSGGLDSLGGVVDHVVTRGEGAVLVTHESTTKLRTRHRSLRAMIDAATTGPPAQHVTVRINKKDLGEKEYTQRCRSFLYAAIATTVACMAELDAIRFFENGVVSLNLPLSPQVVGSRATRTTHPRVLSGMRRLFSLVTGSEFGVDNGFIWKTKADVVQGIVDAGHGPMIPFSTSCTHTWTFSNAKPHCGECSQCIDRRFAVLAGGAGVFERADTYKRDLLLDGRGEGESRVMLASYTELAQQVARMSEAAFFGRFGEAARVLRHVGMPDDEAARAIVELYRRHGEQVVSVIDAGLSEHSPRIRSRDLPSSCLLRLVHDPSVAAGGEGTGRRNGEVHVSEPDYQLMQRGQGWVLRFAGSEIHLRESIGLIYLRELISFPGKAFTVAQLLIAARPEARHLATTRGEPAFDMDAAKAYGMRLQELNGAIDEAERKQDFTLLDAHKREKDELLAELRQANFRGRPRVESRDHKRLRDRVRNGLARAIETISKYDKPAADHFRESLSCGSVIVYAPVDAPDWVL